MIAVGKLSAYYAQGVAEYAKRLQGFCKFEIVELSEETINEKNASKAVIDSALQKEGVRILAAVPKNAKIVAMCVEGKHLTSEEFSQTFNKAAQSGTSCMAFAIGSSHGLCNTVKDKAFLKLSLSKMTLPHQLARLVLTEQIYRALSITAGIKYHK